MIQFIFVPAWACLSSTRHDPRRKLSVHEWRFDWASNWRHGCMYYL